ncbi:MAG: HRDC domain-containing protein [Methanoregula sp.]|nr:HRDC domain-containing protein [Methanoregula sp.]
MSAEDTALFLRLKSLRKAIADRNGVPPYVIFPEKSLHELACARPGDRENFSLIYGVGEYKLEKYEPEFMEEIRKR